MRRLIVTIAIGDKSWGQKALSLALSIRANDESIHTGIIYSKSAIEGIEELIEQNFDLRLGGAEFGSKDSRSASFKTKTELYQIAREYDEIIYMDADQIVLPGKKVSEWFDECGKNDVVFFTNDILDLATNQRSRTDHTFWFDVEKAVERFELRDNICKSSPVLPQIDACFFYFKKGYRAKFFFEIAQEVYNSDFETVKYKGAKLAEPCFNIALSKMGIIPTPNGEHSYSPVYLEAFEKPQSQEFIQHQYRSFGFAGMNKPTPALQNYYNKLSDYYRDYFGIIPKYRMTTSNESISGYKTYGFYHVCLVNHWAEIVGEQLVTLIKSGLYEKSSAIFIGCAYKEKSDVELLKAFLKDYPKFKISTVKTLDQYEFPTLELIERKANEVNEQPFIGYYMHTKGVSFPDKKNRVGGDYWRQFMGHYNITKWKDCQQKLADGFDTCGVNLKSSKDGWPTHYSGNFFHFNSNYIKKLPKLNTVDKTDRFQAEFWIGSAEPLAASLKDEHVDYHVKKKFKI